MKFNFKIYCHTVCGCQNILCVQKQSSQKKIMFSRGEKHAPSSWGNSWAVNLLEAGRIFWRMFTIILVKFITSFQSIYYWLLSEIIQIQWRWLVGLTNLFFFWNSLCQSPEGARKHTVPLLVMQTLSPVPSLASFIPRKLPHTNTSKCVKDKIVNLYYLLRNHLRNSTCAVKAFSLKPGENIKVLAPTW